MNFLVLMDTTLCHIYLQRSLSGYVCSFVLHTLAQASLIEMQILTFVVYRHMTLFALKLEELKMG